MKALKQSILLTISSLIIILSIFISASFLFASKVDAQNEIPALFVSNSCQYSADLKEDLLAEDFESKYEFQTIEITQDRDRTTYQNAYETCRPNAQVRYTPMLFYEGKCYEGKTNVKKKLYELANLEYVDSANGSEAPEDEKTAVELVKEEETTQEGQSLEESINGNKAPELPKISFLEWGALLIFPSMFIAIAYLLIKRMKL